MTPREVAETWNKIVFIYQTTIENNNPKFTMEQIIEQLGLETVKETFAVISTIKKDDGRIYGFNRKYMGSIVFNPTCIELNSNNPVLRSGIDEIHTAHINQLITELIYFEKEA